MLFYRRSTTSQCHSNTAPNAVSTIIVVAAAITAIIILTLAIPTADIFVDASSTDSKCQDNPVTYGVYLAGPEVFLKDAIRAGEQSKIDCEKANNPDLPFRIEAFYPLDAKLDDDVDGQDENRMNLGYRIFQANVGLIDKCAVTVANMVRFRGPSMDVGTAYEKGYTLGSGKPVFGYYDAVPFYGKVEESVLYQDKVHGHGFSDHPSAEFDMNGLSVERVGYSDNLMLLGTLEQVGYPQRLTVYESCMDVVDWIQKNCLANPSDCLKISKCSDH